MAGMDPINQRQYFVVMMASHIRGVLLQQELDDSGAVTMLFDHISSSNDVIVSAIVPVRVQ